MQKILDTFGGIAMLVLAIGYTFGGIIGAGIAVAQDQAMHAVLCLLVPFYGLIYSLVAVFS